jgi:ATP-dependent Clp protease ATP-binding subunit ClpA
MTSNIGSQYIQKMETIGFANLAAGTEYANVKERVMEALKDYFKPEFLNRLDDTIIFDVLSKEEITSIVKLHIRDIAARIKEKEIELVVTDDALNYIGEKSYDPHFGARPVKRYVQTHILNEVANLMLAKKFMKGGIAEVSLDKKGELIVEAKKPRKILSPIQMETENNKEESR